MTKTPRPAHAGVAAKSFSIIRETRVSWFGIRQLCATGAKTLTATIVGSMSGRREIMAALDQSSEDNSPLPTYEGADELWIDYVADTGDGWNATASVAWLVGRDALKLDLSGKPTPQPAPGSCTEEISPTAQDGHEILEAGRILVLGGDQVYPTASATEYQRRFIDPFRCARYFQQGGRHVYAIPGNHDWYDGLTGFLRLFCQRGPARRWFGAWQAQQTRSYFALKLPHNWWLWGVDMAFEDDLDPPQNDYFTAQAKNLKPGDKLILCVPNPSWIKTDPEDFERDQTPYRMAEKMNLIMDLATVKVAGRSTPIPIPLILTGDLHYYARHQAKLPGYERDYVICGGGGAFGLGTLQVPDTLELPRSRQTPKDTDAVLAKTYPSRDESRKLRSGIMQFPFVSRVFTASLAVASLITLWMLASFIRQASGGDNGWIAWLMATGWQDLGRVWCESVKVAWTSPNLFMWWAILLGGFTLFAWSGKPRDGNRVGAVAAGILHACMQIFGGIACCWLAAKLVSLGGNTREFDQWASVIIASVILYFYSGFLFGGYLLVSHMTIGLHDQEVFSAQGIEDFKSFLRIRIDQKGLTVYPIGLRKVAQDWKAAPGVKLGKPERTRTLSIFHTVDVPANTLRVLDPVEPLEPHLIEPPVRIT